MIELQSERQRLLTHITDLESELHSKSQSFATTTQTLTQQLAQLSTGNTSFRLLFLLNTHRLNIHPRSHLTRLVSSSVIPRSTLSMFSELEVSQQSGQSSQTVLADAQQKLHALTTELAGRHTFQPPVSPILCRAFPPSRSISPLFSCRSLTHDEHVGWCRACISRRLSLISDLYGFIHSYSFTHSDAKVQLDEAHHVQQSLAGRMAELQVVYQQQVQHNEEAQVIHTTEVNALKAKMRHAQVEWNSWYQTAVSVERSILTQMQQQEEQAKQAAEAAQQELTKTMELLTAERERTQSLSNLVLEHQVWVPSPPPACVCIVVSRLPILSEVFH